MKRFLSGMPISAIYFLAIILLGAVFFAYMTWGTEPYSTPTPTITPVITPTATPTITPTSTITPSPAPVLRPTSASSPTSALVPSSTPLPAPLATPLRAPALTATAVPTAAPAAGTSGERALRTVRYLAETIGSRPAGSSQERASAGYIAEQLRSYGYTPQTLDFPFPYFVDRGSTVQVVSPQGIQLHPLTLGLSAAGDVDGTIVSVGLGRPEDLPRDGLKGRVALIQRGDITYELKVENVAKAGAVAAIIFNNAQGNFQGRLGQIAGIPAVSISLDEGNRLLQSLSGGAVSVRLSVNATSEQRTGQNIMATRQGASPDTVIFGAHYDSVEAGPGADDNASGVAAVLELARLARSGALTQRFIAFSAEELGFFGSSSYVSTLSLQERQQVKAMVSLDMVGVGDRMRFGGDQQLVDAGLAIAGGLGIQALRLEGSAAGGSDHTSFTSAGMPAALFTYTVGNDLDPRYHTAEDKASFVDPANIDKAVQVCQLLIARLAGGR